MEIDYIFSVLFLLIFALSFFKISENKLPAIAMFTCYAAYIFFAMPLVNLLGLYDQVDSAHLYFILLASLDSATGIYLSYLYLNKNNKMAKYLAFIEFGSVLNHFHGRLFYEPGWDFAIYQSLSISVTVAIITLMIWPLINGLFSKMYKFFNGARDVAFNVGSRKECSFTYASKI